MHRALLQGPVPVTPRWPTKQVGGKMMFCHSRNSNVTTAFMLAVVFGLIALSVPSATLGMSKGKKSCDGDVYEKLECRQGAIADQLEYTSDVVFAEGTRLHQNASPARLEHIRNAKEKAQRAKKKNTSEFFKRQVKANAHGNKPAGHFVPFDDQLDDVDGNGICDYEQPELPGYKSASCAAIELDEFGNLQICNPEKKNKGKGKGGGNPKFEGLECDRVFDSEQASTGDEELDMSEEAEQLEATLSATEDDLIDMNDSLDAVNNTPASPAILFQANGCVIPGLTEGLSEAAAALRAYHNAVNTTATVVKDLTGQTAFGFNGRGGAAALSAAAGAVNTAYIIVDELAKAEQGALQSAIMDCVGDTAAQISELQAQVEQMREEIMAKLEDVTTLLNTPQGRRPDFPEGENSDPTSGQP